MRVVVGVDWTEERFSGVKEVLHLYAPQELWLVHAVNHSSEQCCAYLEEVKRPMIRIKRVYSEPSASDGVRILVDRVWPRGISKERANIVEWQKDVAPSTSLRKWFGHDPAKWTEFRKRYRAELKRPDQLEALKKLAQLSSRRTVTLVYSAADEEHNQAVVLKELLEELA